jgi:hypothetical protein
MPVGSECFHYDAKERIFSAEASELPGTCECCQGFDRFSMVSQWTGKVMSFWLVRVERDADNDIQAWHFYAKQAKLRAVIFND